MNLEYLIDNSNINNVKKFILENNTDLKKEIYKKKGKLKTFLEVSFVTFIILIPMVILSLNIVIFPDSKGNYFSFLFNNLYEIMFLLTIILLILGAIFIVLGCIYTSFIGKIGDKIYILNSIGIKYSVFKGLNKIAIKENEIYVERIYSNLTIESKIIENIIKHKNTIYFIDKNNAVLLFIPLDEVNKDTNKIILCIEECLKKKVSER